MGKPQLVQIITKRIYEPPLPQDGVRVLVDRIWPRGISKKAAAIDLWAKDIAPSTELRKWFNHDQTNWEEFQVRYREELEQQATTLRDLLACCSDRSLTLLFAAKDTEHNQAVVLAEVLRRRISETPVSAAHSAAIPTR